MSAVFADTFYWIALANPRDAWHGAAKTVSQRLRPFHIVTSDEVLAEFLTFFSGWGKTWRDLATKFVQQIRSNPNITVVEQSRASFDRGLGLFAARVDKEYSMTDCSSMETMRARQLKEVLTHDHHFEQESFTILLTSVSP